MNPRLDALKRRGWINLAFAVGVGLLGLLAEPGAMAVMNAVFALIFAWQGQRIIQHAVPLDEAERKELAALEKRSPLVRRFVTAARAHGEPLRLDLVSARRLARLEAMQSQH